MRTRTLRRAIGLAVAGALAGALLAACTSSSSSTTGSSPTSPAPPLSPAPTATIALPVVHGNGYSIGIPSDWSRCAIPYGGPEIPATDQFRPSAAAFAPIVDVSNEQKTRTFEHATSFHELVLEVTPHFKELSKSSVQVPGATAAQRIEYTQESPYPTKTGDFPVVHGVSLVAQAADGSVFALIVSAQQADWDQMETTMVSIVASFRLGTSGNPVSLPVCAGIVTGSPPSPTG